MVIVHGPKGLCNMSVYPTLGFERSWGFFSIAGGHRPVLVSCTHGRFGTHNRGCLDRPQNRNAFQGRS